jgi:hypothetical protein
MRPALSKTMSAWPVIILTLMLALPHAAAQESSPPMTAEGTLHPSRLAAESDLVVLVQLERTDYQRRRGFPVSGTAWARVLLRYKVPEPIDLVRIDEEGFGPDRCYFPDVPLWQELPRYLLFLERGEGRDYTGHRAGCMLEVLVTRDNRYAVRWPQDDLLLNEEDLALVETLEFIGPGATLDASDSTTMERAALIEDDAMEDLGDRTLRYTRGIPLEVFRERIMGSDALTRDRQQR